MNEPSVTGPAELASRNAWLDAYMPDGQPAQPAASSRLINFDFIRGILYRQRWLVAAAIATSLVIGIVWSLLATPMYEARATIRLIPYGATIVEGQDTGEGFASNQLNNYIATQIEVIKSNSLAETIARDNNLGERYDLVGADIDQSRPEGVSDEKWRDRKNARAAKILSQGVYVDKPEGNWVIGIGFRSSKPALTAEVANLYADAAIAMDARKSLDNSQYAIEYLKREIESTRERLRDAEEAANLYARTAGIIVEQTTTTEAGTSPTLTTSTLTNFNQRFADARAARIAAEQRWRAVQNLPASQLVEVQSSTLLPPLINSLTEKRSDLTELRQRYNDDFPQIITLTAQIRALEEQIDRVGSEIKSSLRSQYLVARNQEEALKGELTSVTTDTLAEQDQRVQFSVLEREAQALSDQLKSLLDRYNQVTSAANATAGNVIKLDSAEVPSRPFAPNPLRNMTIALVFGVALAAGLSILRETLDDRVRSLDDVEEKIGLTLLGHTPYIDEREIEAQEADRFSALMESYSSIRAAIDFSLSRHQNVVLLTSCNASEGKSTTAVILAELFGALGRHTLLIDCDLRRPSIAKLMDRERPKVGVAEVVLGHVELEDAVLKGVHKNLDILPVGQIPPNPTELAASPAFAEFLAKCRNQYSLVIIDTAPVLGLADAPILSRLADATIVVLEANRVPFGQVRAVTRRLQMAGANLIGVVLTKYRALEAGQSYNYQYGYYDYSSTKE